MADGGRRRPRRWPLWRHRGRWGRSPVWRCLATVALSAALVGGLVGFGRSNAEASHPLRGVVSLRQSANFTTDGDDCAGTGPYAALHAGAPVIVTTPAGERLMAGEIGQARVNNSGDCVLTFNFTLRDRPDYVFAIADLPPRAITRDRLVTRNTAQPWLYFAFLDLQ